MTSHRLNGINACPAILMEGAVIERLRRETDLELAAAAGRKALQRISAQQRQGS